MTNENHSDEQEVHVTIHGTDYILQGHNDVEFIHRVAEFVDQRMSEIGKEISTESVTDLAIMTALNVAHDLFLLQRDHEETTERIHNDEQERSRLVVDLNNLEQERSRLVSELHSVKQERSRFTDELKSIEHERSRLVVDLHTLETERSQVVDELFSIKQERSRLANELQDLKEERSRLANELQNIERERSHLNEEIIKVDRVTRNVCHFIEKLIGR
ncbi:MAG: cell division protein ZapA [Candidatus Electryoneaceae bacterium]|nr:cell division protein ZapA [Candidatus Electryoneaceae bacterium]